MATTPKAQKQPGRLHVARLTVHNVLGIEDSTIDLSTITLLEGRNGSAKSSHVKALRSALGVDRTSLARLARVREDGTPADDPTVEVLLVGEDREVRVTKKGGDSAKVDERVGDDWREVKRPVEWLRDLVDTQAANPALWLASDDEAKAVAVLEAMPLDGYDRTAALVAAGLESFRLPPIPGGMHPLVELEHIEDAVFSARTKVHEEERREHDAATKLLAGLPADAPADIAGEVEALERTLSVHHAEIVREESDANAAEDRAIQAAEADHRVVMERVSGSFKGDAAKLRRAHETMAAEIRADAERRIAALLAETEAAVDGLKTEGEADLQAADAALDASRTAARQAREKARVATEGRKREQAKGREELSGLRARQQSIETDKHVRATAAEAEKKAREHHARAKALTESIEALKRYRLELAEKLPVKGLAVKFDEKGRKSLTLDGVPLSQVNDGRLAQLATEVSLLRTKPPKAGQPYLPIVLLDGLEKVDPSARAALLREVAARGSQVIAAVVGQDSLRVLTPETATA